ncbi:NlpC/P60 family protein [Pseudonocardia sp. CA-107938]
MLPGDLIFYGSTERVTHVALYLGNSQIINAPTFRPARPSTTGPLPG